MHLVVCAPAGPVERPLLGDGVQQARARGFTVTVLDGVDRADGYLAGDDAHRLAELQRAVAAGDAVWAARGGYGASRIVDRVDWTRCTGLIGFSDVTVLHLAALRHGVGLVVHGPSAEAKPGRLDAAAWDAWAAAVRGHQPTLEAGTTLVPGVARGPLVGGNLSLLASTLGTPDAAVLDGAVLLVEEVGEAPYRIDRMLTQLLRAGVLARAAGVVVGGLTRCHDRARPAPTAAEVVAERVRAAGRPAVTGWSLGHGVGQRSVLLGRQVVLDATAGTLAPA